MHKYFRAAALFAFLLATSSVHAQTRATGDDSDKGQPKVTPRSSPTVKDLPVEMPVVKRSASPKVQVKNHITPEVRLAELRERFAQPTPRGRAASADTPELRPVPRVSARSTR